MINYFSLFWQNKLAFNYLHLILYLGCSFTLPLFFLYHSLTNNLKSFSRGMNLFECPVCLIDMVDRSPRSLSCLHTFCSECLDHLINEQRIECPTCREITELKTNNVQELKVNFMLGQMRDREQKQAQASNKETNSSPDKPRSMCEVCQQTSAIFKCKDCPQLLCGTCRKRHEDIQEFKDHSVFDLCQKHQQGITHLCKQCVRPLCMRCMMLDHTEHKTHFMKYDQGITELQNDAKKLQNSIKEEMDKADKSYKEVDRKYQSVTEIESGLMERRKRLVAQLKECDEYLKQTASSKEVYKNLKDMFHQGRNQWTVAATSLYGLISSKSGFCEKYEKITEKADQCLRDIKKVIDVEYTLPPFILADPSSGEIVKNMTSDAEVKNLKLEKTLRTIVKSDKINCKCDSAFIGSDVLFPTSEKPYHVIRLSKKGEVVARYYPKDTEKDVWAVDVYNNDIYMLQDKTITVITHREENNSTYIIDRSDMSGMLVKDKTTIFVSQWANPGGLFKYATVASTTESLVKGLNIPSFMSRMYTPGGYRYIVTEQEEHRINIYTERWELLHSFGGFGSSSRCFNRPASTAITSMGTILVADNRNHRISHYRLDGQFLSHVITKDDGIEFPFAMSYKHPYLWVCCEGTPKSVKCFELKEL